MGEPSAAPFPSWPRFVISRIRKTFGFDSIPIRITYRQKTRRE